MYTLLRGFWDYISQKNEFSVLILGLDGAGKTTFLEQAKINFVPNYRAIPMQKITTTVGLNIGCIEIDGIRLKFWDLGGQEELQSLWDKSAFHLSEINKVFYDSLHLVGQRQCTFHGVSALNGEGVNSSIKWIADKVKGNAEQRPPKRT
ncbi:unnamed protein product [Schistosoma turkestanicum]|nr:unnamed protein product [Schistosoma turkestanicum]